MKLSIFFLLLSLSSLAQENREYRSCYNVQTQEQSMGITIDYGDYSGMCFNDVMMKAIEQTSLPSFLDQDQFILVKNFSHQGEYFYALIDLYKIKANTQVIMQLERFNPKWIAGHTQLRYQFSENAVELYRNIEDIHLSKKPAFRLNDIVTSIEAMRPFGKNYSLIDGTQRKFLAVFRMKSLSDVAIKAIKNKNDSIEQFKIKFERQENKRLLLEYYIQSGTKKGYSLEYNTVTFNCTNGLYFQAEPIVKSVGKKINTVQKIKLALPVLASGALEKSNLIDERLSNFSAMRALISATRNNRDLSLSTQTTLIQELPLEKMRSYEPCGEEKFRHHGICLDKKKEER